MSGNPYESPGATGESPTRATGTLTGWLFKLLVGVGVIGIAVALLIPASRRTTPKAARRALCANNLKQIARALLNYESTFHALPPAHTVDAAGKPLHSWRTLILPYLEQVPLYAKVDLSKPWDDPANKAVYDTPLPAYQCPSIDVPPNHTTYLAVVAPGGCFRPAEPRKLSEIADFRSQTLMVVEVDSEHHVHWMSPTDASEQTILNLGESESLPHAGGVQALCVDGHVFFLSSDAKVPTLRALISIAGMDDAILQESD